MSKLSDYRLLCFDVYGTLIDWESGLEGALQPLLEKGNAHIPRAEILKIFQDLEHEQETLTPGMPYYQVLASVHPKIAQRLSLPPPTEEESGKFGESVGTWPAFPDTVDALKRLSKHFKLVVLSNVDRESFAKTNAGSLDGVNFDRIITAQDVGSYKPDLQNFEYMLKTVQSELGVGKEQVLSTAQSQFHDHRPASKVGIKSVWIQRQGSIIGNISDPIYDWRFDTLGDMASAVEGGQ